jgi:hypothetical protein
VSDTETDPPELELSDPEVGQKTVQDEPVVDLETLLDAVAPRQRGPRAVLTNTPLVLQVIYGIATHQGTKRELASIFGVSSDTLSVFFRDNPDAQDAWERGRGAGKLSLRRLLWRTAQADPTTARYLASDKRWLKMNAKEDGAAATQTLVVLSDEDRVAKILELQKKARLPSPGPVIEAETVETERRK